MFNFSDTTKKERRSLDILGTLYAAMINSNILCNLFHELGYVFTLLTVKNHEIKSNNDNFSSNNIYFKSSDDCHYFASKTIEQLVSILTYLEKPIINLILKQKVINAYAPELAKTFENKFNSLVSKYTQQYYVNKIYLGIKCTQILRITLFSEHK